MIVFRVLNKFQSILNKHQKLRVIELTLMMILGGFMEMLSVSLMLSFMNAVMKPEETMKKWYSKLFCRIFHIGSDETRKFLILLAIVLAALYIIKNLYLLLQNNFQYRFVYNNMFYTQQKDTIASLQDDISVLQKKYRKAMETLRKIHAIAEVTED